MRKYSENVLKHLIQQFVSLSTKILCKCLNYYTSSLISVHAISRKRNAKQVDCLSKQTGLIKNYWIQLILQFVKILGLQAIRLLQNLQQEVIVLKIIFIFNHITRKNRCNFRRKAKPIFMNAELFMLVALIVSSTSPLNESSPFISIKIVVPSAS